MIILASGSPRRRELLSSITEDFIIIKAKKDEIVTKSVPHEIVEELSKQKASEVWERCVDDGTVSEDDVLLIAADTLVFLGDKRMGKPKDEDDAIAMLSKLSGRTHEVYTGVTLFFGNKEHKKEKTFYSVTKVTFCELTDGEIKEYVAGKEPMDKAGAYAIQGGFGKYIEGIEGEYYNVVGLPIASLYKEMKLIGYFDEK